MANERFLLAPWNSIDFALFSAKFLLSMTRTQRKADLDAVIRDDGNRILDSDKRNNLSVGTYNYQVWVPEGVFVFIGGLTERDEAEQLWNGYLGPRTVLPHSPIPNPYIASQYAALNDEIRFRFLTTDRLTVAGHSFGGCIAPMFMRQSSGLSTFAATDKCISFGSPCTYTAANAEVFRQLPLIRYMNSDDPVPLVPFMDTVIFGASWTYGTHQCTNANSFRHVGRGLNLGLDNSLFDGDLPVAAGANRTASVTSWLAQAGQGLINSHSLDTYVARLTAVRQANLQPRVPAPTPHVGQPLAIAGGSVRAMQENAVNTIITDANRRNMQPVVIPSQQLFVARRQGRLWFVEFGGTIISTSMNKKRARGLSRIGNDFLRRLQRQEIVAVDDTAQQFLTYLSLASTPGTGITPTMNQGFPATP